MSLLSSLILPHLEKELLALEPEIASFVLKQLKVVATDVITWIESKAHVDLNSDGVLGEDKSEEN